MVARLEDESHLQKDHQYPSNSTDKVNGYLHETNAWLDIVLECVPNEDDRKRVKKLIASKVQESYRNGKKTGPA